MRRTESQSQILKMTILRSTCTLNRGSVTFSVTQETNTYEDGSVKVELRYSKQDGREYTDLGRSFQTYKSDRGMANAIKRLMNTGEFTREVENYI